MYPIFIGSEHGVAEQYTTRAFGHNSWNSLTILPVMVGASLWYRFFAWTCHVTSAVVIGAVAVVGVGVVVVVMEVVVVVVVVVLVVAVVGVE